MKCFVSWSGGFDSTYLILYYLEKGYNVVAQYTEILNNENKTKAELNAIDKLIILIRKKYKNFNFLITKNKYEVDANSDRTRIAIAQPSIWLHSLLFSDNKNCDLIGVGYILGNHAISYIEDIKNVWEAYSYSVMTSFPY